MMGLEGPSARPPRTVFKVFQRAVENHGERPALYFKDLYQVTFCYLGLSAGCRLLLSPHSCNLLV